MRRDIQAVVFERAKSNRTWASKTPRVKGVVLDAEGEHIREGTPKLKRQKWRNSHFNAVGRFLLRNTGRPWNKVYAELCASADGRTRLGREVREYAECSVALQCWLDGRKVMSFDVHGAPREVTGLYVHPKTGVLLRSGT